MLRRQVLNIEDLRRRAPSPARRATRRHWLSVSPSTTCVPSQRAMTSWRSRRSASRTMIRGGLRRSTAGNPGEPDPVQKYWTRVAILDSEAADARSNLI